MVDTFILMFCAFFLRDFKQYPLRESVQHTVLFCEENWHDNLLTYVIVVGRCFRLHLWALNAFVHHSSMRNRLTLHCSGFTFKCMKEFVLYLNIFKESNQT